MSHRSVELNNSARAGARRRRPQYGRRAAIVADLAGRGPREPSGPGGALKTRSAGSYSMASILWRQQTVGWATPPRASADRGSGRRLGNGERGRRGERKWPLERCCSAQHDLILFARPYAWYWSKKGKKEQPLRGVRCLTTPARSRRPCNELPALPAAAPACCGLLALPRPTNPIRSCTAAALRAWHRFGHDENRWRRVCSARSHEGRQRLGAVGEQGQKVEVPKKSE